ncbi:MAG: Holliday junction ATP-dependent DNA helicase RuvA [Candidatus Yanofskybacteria bacterium GW2011_GWF1_44_227]|uniref:Holliday junction branch migration complex subunit RuvA n=1 Tax=Candidatus Yanofskybacteria bacterium GW2011_GWE2_40_11 TaxID=1619033 RepID=A0A0G0TSI5_9BACT|nr:MAG: Holliday junction ATP-dependent DNA helicase RuvA [Candidatus Yanofskybacteria bacterium GW2011_GWE1_40_10]KKR40822.1 MAG: Holliday junction ATP-dependent DNA helicase RuvA [Candidatus Yanofskybacteria bacterium GW2011_GWE2_40_11]KKT15937.1 MAG: Holliday junction ATP-dependent DNA helicase RuvA [Candidatus Yanofskybacteria bacterium GW2011_GWF2_43_596]KKT53549.1 MAG: Holliday junction ATP-dependent DNA helicase RuvA [Candidatus Yanofskybacteria bacterium GW2011_GWF1_44_227]OGN36074.1 MA
MISFLEGTIEYLGDKYLILNAGLPGQGGIGYRVIVSPKLLNIVSKEKVDVNRKIKLYVHSQLNMREGTFDLYGFDRRQDLELFHLLKTVNGVGSKNAMAILTVVEPQHLKAAVMNGDADYLKKVSGFGGKLAQRLVLELKTKVDYIDAADVTGMNLGEDSSVVEALVALGYSTSQATNALKEVGGGKSLEERVREALKILGKK